MLRVRCRNKVNQTEQNSILNFILNKELGKYKSALIAAPPLLLRGCRNRAPVAVSTAALLYCGATVAVSTAGRRNIRLL